MQQAALFFWISGTVETKTGNVGFKDRRSPSPYRRRKETYVTMKKCTRGSKTK